MDHFFKQAFSSRVYEVALHTPLEPAEFLSARLNNRVFLKREDKQPVRSFKIRGAYNKIAHLNLEERKRGLICASAGNHAQGVAYSAQRLGIPATVVMPITTPEIKVRAVKAYGAEVILFGDSYSEAAEHCNRIRAERGATYIPPFDDLHVIAGQGTIGIELLQDCPQMNIVFVCIGGGGLISGIASVIKSIRPETLVIGVEPDDSDAMKRSLEAGKRVVLNEVGVFADGVAVKQVGVLTFELARRFVDEVILVSTDETCAAIRDIYEDTRAIMEPAGALAVAGMTKYVQERGISNSNLIAITSGANMNFQRLQFVAERILTGSHEEALFAVDLAERPGALREFCASIIGDKPITEFNYRLSDRQRATIFVGLGLCEEEDRQSLCQRMTERGFGYFDLTDNNLATTHIRHMVGGKASLAKNEKIFRVWFPERRGALAEFLSKMSPSWNISLFHYRYHGSDFGRVLIGFEIGDAEDDELKGFLKSLNYPYQEETDNPAYRLFL